MFAIVSRITSRIQTRCWETDRLATYSTAVISPRTSHVEESLTPFLNSITSLCAKLTLVFYTRVRVE